MATPKKLRRIFKIGAALLLLSLVAGAAILSWLAPRLGDELAEALSAKTGKPVSLGRLQWKIFPRVHFRGGGLQVGDQDDPLVVNVAEFELETGFLDLFADPRRIDRIVVRDVVVKTAPRAPSEKSPRPDLPPDREKAAPSLLIEQIAVLNLRIERRSGPDKPTQLFLIQKALLSSFDLSRPIAFEVWLSYPRPPGDLEVKGEFGPWNLTDARETPYRASFKFLNADLSVFGGIRGILEAAGSFEGTIMETTVEGRAEIPDFALTRTESVVPLRVDFSATVQERGRRILLNQVTTDFFDTTLVTRGEVSAVENLPGRNVALVVEGREARVEDLTRFGLRSDQPPPLTGAIQLRTSVSIPPGSARFRDRMRVEGDFRIVEGRFTNVSIQDTLAKVGRAGGGEGVADQGSSVVSEMTGDFVMEKGILDFSRLEFEVPGVGMELAGSYGFDGESLDFRGNALLQRTPSDMAPESAGRWIKLIDPLFRRGKFGTSLPITIRGNRARPVFKVDVKRIGKP